MYRRFLIIFSLLCLTAMLCLYVGRRAAAETRTEIYDEKSYNKEIHNAERGFAELTISPAHVLPATPQSAQKQKGVRPARNRRGRISSLPLRRTRASNSYKIFQHDSPTHLAVACASCHTIKSVSRIDVVEYPDHDACLSCHQTQFFNGARPNICTVCHVVSSPRDGRRLTFPKPARGSEFANIFPHDQHQYVIAELAPAHRQRDSLFVQASFTKASLDSKQNLAPKPVESCATCHLTDNTPRNAPTEWIADEMKVLQEGKPPVPVPVPVAGTFKSSPTGHASCFNCHFQSQAPIATDCNGCHGLSSARGSNITPRNAQASAATAAARRTTTAFMLKLSSPHNPNIWLERVSAKFRHEREDHKDFSCASCHTNILDAVSLADLAADVPIATCSSCHAGRRKDIQGEMDKEKADAAFNCAYCHQSGVGSRDAPLSHYRIIGRTPPASAASSSEIEKKN